MSRLCCGNRSTSLAHGPSICHSSLSELLKFQAGISDPKSTLTILIALNGVSVTALICSLCLPGHTCLVYCQRQVFTAVSTAAWRYLQSSRLRALLCLLHCQDNYHPQSDSRTFVLCFLIGAIKEMLEGKK